MIDLALLALAAAVVFAVAWRVRRARFEAGSEHWLPSALRDAELVYRERTFAAKRPLRLVARVDRAYRRLDGIIVLVELKTRPVVKTYLSDVIELSAQRLALEAHTGQRVDDTAYVVVDRGQRVKRIARPVKLLPNEEIVALAAKREMILAGQAPARCTTSKGVCAHCSYQRECREF